MVSLSLMKLKELVSQLKDKTLFFGLFLFHVKKECQITYFPRVFSFEKKCLLNFFYNFQKRTWKVLINHDCLIKQKMRAFIFKLYNIFETI